MRVFLRLTRFPATTPGSRGASGSWASTHSSSRYQHPFGYGTQRKEPGVLKLARLAVRRRVQALDQGRGAVVRAFWLAAVTSTRTLLFLWALVRFDTFVFSCGTTFFRYRELPILRLLGKRVIHYFHGNDSRPAYIDGFCESSFLPDRRPTDTAYVGFIGEGEPEEETLRRTVAYIRATSARRESVARIERYADVIISSPSYAHFHSRPFVQRVIIGRPSVPDGMETAPRGTSAGGPARILHSPSVPEEGDAEDP
jgi:hypothetical protein